MKTVTCSSIEQSVLGGIQIRRESGFSHLVNVYSEHPAHLLHLLHSLFLFGKRHILGCLWQDVCFVCVPLSLSLAISPASANASVPADNPGQNDDFRCMGRWRIYTFTARCPASARRGDRQQTPAMALFSHPTLPTLPLIGLLLLSRDHRRVLGFAVGGGSGSLRQVPIRMMMSSIQEQCCSLVCV